MLRVFFHPTDELFLTTGLPLLSWSGQEFNYTDTSLICGGLTSISCSFQRRDDGNREGLREKGGQTIKSVWYCCAGGVLIPVTDTHLVLSPSLFMCILVMSVHMCPS